MLAGAYSNQYRLVQEQQLTKLKVLSAAAGDAKHNPNDHGNKNGKSRQLSLETNKRRKLQEMRRKMVSMKEEERRQDILSQRRQLQQEVTEKFQRAPIQKTKTKKNNLDEILYIIRGETPYYNTVNSRKHQRCSSARLLPKEKDKRSYPNAASPTLKNGIKLLTNRPSSQPVRSNFGDGSSSSPSCNPNAAYLHDQSLKNLTNSRNLFEQQLRRQMLQEDKMKVSELPKSLKSKGGGRQNDEQEDEESDSDDDEDNDDDYDDDDLNNDDDDDIKDFPPLGCTKEKNESQGTTRCNHFTLEANKQIKKQAKPSSKTGSKLLKNHEKLEEKPPPPQQQQQQAQRYSTQFNQSVPSDQPKSPAIVALASGDGKMTPWSTQPNDSSAFRKTAWIQPSPNPNNKNSDSSSNEPTKPAWINHSKTNIKHWNAVVHQPNSKEKNEEGLSDKQTTTKKEKHPVGGISPPCGTAPVCGGPIKQMIFQPKHNFYERQLTSSFQPEINSISQQMYEVWVREKEEQQKKAKHNFNEHQSTASFEPETSSISQQMNEVWEREKAEQKKKAKTSISSNLSAEVYAVDEVISNVSDGGTCDPTVPSVPFLQALRTNAASNGKYKVDVTKQDENRLKCFIKNRAMNTTQQMDKVCHKDIKSAERTENNNNAIVRTDSNENAALTLGKNSPQNLMMSKLNKDGVWQENVKNHVGKAKQFSGHCSSKKPVRGILKTPSFNKTGHMMSGIISRDLKDSLEITKLHRRTGDITLNNTESKAIKKHVHFATENKFYELNDETNIVVPFILNCDEQQQQEDDKKGKEGNNEEILKNNSIIENQTNNSNQSKQNANDQEKANDKENSLKKSLQNGQVNWVNPCSKPQAKAHIIKQTPATTTSNQGTEGAPQSTGDSDPTKDKKSNSDKPFNKNNNIQHITMGTLKRLVASNNYMAPNNKTSFLWKDLETPAKEASSPPSFIKPGFAVDQTPTDEEINWLWDKVQDCLQQKSPPKPIPPSVNRTKPTLSHMNINGSVFGKNNALSVGRMTSPYWPGPTNNGGPPQEAKPPVSYSKRLALFQQKAGLPAANRSPMMITPERVLTLPTEPCNSPVQGLSNKYPSQPFASSSPKDVTSSMAGFLKAEEMMQNMASASESQILLAMKEAEAEAEYFQHQMSTTNNGHHHHHHYHPSPPPPNYRGGPPSSSILSLEEKRLMESLERINNKLKGCPDYGQTLNGFTKPFYFTDQLQGIKMPLMKQQQYPPPPPNNYHYQLVSQVPLKGWMKGAEY